MKITKSTFDELQCLSQVYAIIARLWLREIDVELIAALNGTEFGNAFQSVGGLIPKMDSSEELAVEYCRLFIGPQEHLSPFQSVWEQRQLQGETTASAQLFAAALHYGQPAGQPVTMMDHFGVELDLMSRAIWFLTTNSGQEKTAVWQLAQEFFSRHLLWSGPFLEATIDRAQLPFYRSVAEMTQLFLKHERQAWLIG